MGEESAALRRDVVTFHDHVSCQNQYLIFSFLHLIKKILSSSDPHRSDLPSGNMWHKYIAYIYINLFIYLNLLFIIYIHEYFDILSVFWHIL